MDDGAAVRGVTAAAERSVAAPERTRRVKGLDGLRGLAASAVVFHHTFTDTLHLGEVAVDLFFVLSGYLITGLLHGQRRKIDQGHSAIGAELRKFWARRALRILPVYYVAFAISMTAYLVSHHDAKAFERLAFFATYLQNFYIGLLVKEWGHFTHTWSLAVEQQYYVVFALLMLAVSARRHMAMALGLAALCLVAVAAIEFSGAPMITDHTLPFSGMVFLLLGGVVAMSRNSLHHRLARSRTAMLVGLAGVLALALLPKEAEYSSYWNRALHLDYTASTIVLSALCFLLISSIVQRQDSRLVRILEAWPLVFLGEISYGMYIFQGLVGGAFAQSHADRLLEQMAPGAIAARAVHCVAAFAVTGVLAYLSFRFMEQPILRLKDRFR